MFFYYDPDEWAPHGPWGRHLDTRTTDRLKPGTLVVWERHPHRVVEVRERAHHEWPEKYREVWVKYGMPDPDSWDYRPCVVVLRDEDRPDSKPAHLLGPSNKSWYLLPEHYSICRLCHELPPCRHVHNEAIVGRASERMEKEMAIMPGVCHGCREPITKRQKAFTFPGANLIRPDLGDGSAVFHTRRACYGALDSYDKRWAKAEPGRERLFYCPGTITEHHDGSSECSRPDCVAKGEHAGLVQHALWLRHHPAMGEAQGCWCLAAVA
ncbi:hypothetical protein [Streptomyces anthocyanicus]|uniref:hypothetical protein n=1 Tax=Streptomyces anthocyanicus TaxID=68174 RepID=UPI003802240B